MGTKHEDRGTDVIEVKDSEGNTRRYLAYNFELLPPMNDREPPPTVVERLSVLKEMGLIT